MESTQEKSHARSEEEDDFLLRSKKKKKKRFGQTTARRERLMALKKTQTQGIQHRRRRFGRKS